MGREIWVAYPTISLDLCIFAHILAYFGLAYNAYPILGALIRGVTKEHKLSLSGPKLKAFLILFIYENILSKKDPIKIGQNLSV